MKPTHKPQVSMGHGFLVGGLGPLAELLTCTRSADAERPVNPTGNRRERIVRTESDELPRLLPPIKLQNHSYQEVPIQYADFSPLRRNEFSGSLSGLTRVRRFHQDDEHILCRPQQIKGEIASMLWFVALVITTFGLGPYRLVLSRKLEMDFIGSLDLLNSAEA
ncbi:uncharacterized protein ATNIH1004_005282 [Aspergillus tanneri]|uniref:Threonyl-tRNA synthetase n=1 Tax=Aspergillus tanneri TaxID=1220188 RepID=A0A5M9MQI5_9EURO|nr:uncharacterized protein ATNIH1004_005282 [Aspergillus tanneri]KAA8649381.1 hypothetical protein ATNIH1004_005282 [Aspergillus tanneri]